MALTIETQIEKYERHMSHLRERMAEDAEGLLRALRDSQVSATSIDLRAGGLANSAHVLFSCETALMALKACLTRQYPNGD